MWNTSVSVSSDVGFAHQPSGLSSADCEVNVVVSLKKSNATPDIISK